MGPQGGLPQAQGRCGGYQGLGKAHGRGGIDELIKKRGLGVDFEGFTRAGIDGPASNNEFESMALKMFGEGFDPGAGQFEGRDVRKGDKI